MLYLVPTPIGNLQDITLRALSILKEVDLIFAEDTRVSGNLLKHFGIQSSLRSFHSHNEHKKLGEVVRLLSENADFVVKQKLAGGTYLLEDQDGFDFEAEAAEMVR